MVLINLIDLEQEIKSNPEIQLINIDSNSEFNKHFIPDSINIPFDSENFKEVLIESIPKNKTIVTYSSSKSENLNKASDLIEELGFKVKVFEEGIESWRNAGLPVVCKKEI